LLLNSFYTVPAPAGSSFAFTRSRLASQLFTLTAVWPHLATVVEQTTSHIYSVENLSRERAINYSTSKFSNVIPMGNHFTPIRKQFIFENICGKPA
jgi:hypothetical protein